MGDSRGRGWRRTRSSFSRSYDLIEKDEGRAGSLNYRHPLRMFFARLRQPIRLSSTSPSSRGIRWDGGSVQWHFDGRVSAVVVSGSD